MTLPLRGLGTVFVRELRSQSRTKATWRWRWWTVLALLGTLAFSLMNAGALASNAAVGLDVYRTLALVLGLLAVLAPAGMVCDALAREVREGTMPLLRLTPLSMAGIILGKGMSGGLRSFGLLLGAVPMLAVPILIGGVGLSEVATTAIGLAGLVLMSLGAGLWASSVARTPGTALMRAHLALTVVLLLVAGVQSGFGSVTGSLMTPRWQVFVFRDAWLELCGVLPDGFFANGQYLNAVGRPWRPPPPKSFLDMATGALWLLAFSVMAAALAVARAELELVGRAALESQGRTESAVAKRFVRIPSALVARHRRWRLGVLARNPLEWLGRRTPQRALMRWFWLGAAGLVWAQMALSMNWMSQYGSGLSWNVFPWILTAAAIWSTATALREERRTGTLEMILVTGLTESQIVRSVLRTTRQTYLPAALLGAVVGQYLGALGYERDSQPFLWSAVAAAWALPGIGLASSLLTRSLAGSLVLTLLVSWGLPLLLFPIVKALVEDGASMRGYDMLVSAWLLCMGEIGRRMAISLIAGRRYTAD